MPNNTHKIGILGLGRMGGCLARGLINSKQFSAKDIFFTTAHPGSGVELEEELKIQRCPNNEKLLAQSQTVILAVKPQAATRVLGELKGKFPKGATLISVAASVPTSEMESTLGGEVAVIRAMPNTPAFVGEAITPLCGGQHVGADDWDRAETIFKTVGRVVRADEKLMDAITGLSGCGPAYTYVVLESLTEGGIKMGLPRDLATQLAAQTVLGAAKMLLETGRHPAELKDEVTTPAGCTIDGLVALEEGGLRVTLIKAVVDATLRAKTLSN